MEKQEKYPSCNVYNGLQKPLVLFGLQGRYIVWAAICAVACFFLFIIGFALFSIWIGIVALAIGLAVSIALISYKQKDGLFSKKRMNGLYVYSSIYKI